MKDADWIRANPGRRFLIRPSEEGEGYFAEGNSNRDNLTAATVISISENWRSWETMNIMVPGAIIDSDDAAERALHHWYRFLFPKLVHEARCRAKQERDRKQAAMAEFVNMVVTALGSSSGCRAATLLKQIDCAGIGALLLEQLIDGGQP